MTDLDRLYLVLRFVRALERAELLDPELKGWVAQTLKALARRAAPELEHKQ